ncbi:Protein argonaute [Lachnellula hyalina]|uniref:Protein argonaute n=1 Tax=Lachnellula hyalina TaxID=1316788 RepID=A0A8H8RB13_9HELO|nr:Protein argonaute [Lachnellula hyalina]TVY30849.1 Protein argonaute [Lachnellula hyalina]
MDAGDFRLVIEKADTSHKFESPLPDRPGFNTVGKAIQIRVNQFKVTEYPTRSIYQYDIQFGNGLEAKGKVMAAWRSKAVQGELKKVHVGPWLWDGNKIAWSCANVQELRITVDFDKEKEPPRAPRPIPDTCRVVIKQTKLLNLAVISAYLAKRMPFDTSVLEGINFFDHLIRAMPSEHYHTQKRSFFSKGTAQVLLDNVIVAQKGVYSSIRLCSPVPSNGGAGTGLAVNVDVANGTFWTVQDLHQAARNYCKSKNRSLDWQVFSNLVKPVNSGNGLTMSEEFKELRKMCKLKFTVKHRTKNTALQKKAYSIKRFVFNASYGAAGGNAKAVSFPLKQKNAAGVVTNTVDISVYDFFKQHYGIHLQYWYLPLIETERDGYFPMEVCTLVANQKYVYKLSPDQTAAMIKFAVTRPKQRIESIQHGVGMLKWHQDPYLQYFGMKVDPNMTVTNARLLQNPEIAYQGAKVNPGTSGRWDLRGKKFLFANPQPLVSWGVMIVGHDTVDEPTVRNFLSVFMQTYTGHGGKIQNRNPAIFTQPRNSDIGEAVAQGRQFIGNAAGGMPQIMLFILPGRDSFMYERLKRSMECRFAMVSQMMNIAHVRKAQPQYCSNVCMKLNSKLGGTTCKIISGPSPTTPAFTRPTMIIGADVSHPSPGSLQASMAAMTMSFDSIACRYAAAVETNGHRVEMISETNINNFFGFLFPEWVKQVGNGRLPQHIYYFRDGVSEGQYAHVLDQEVAMMKAFIEKKYPGSMQNIRFTITVCSKRHHIRFFPRDGDRNAADNNANSLPGTLVERDVTHPFEYDFYLSSHSAIQGTARPTHYHVLKDEAKMPPNEFRAMIYKHCYQYQRSTTPVSLFPAVYYAHLASNRARAHEGKPASEGPRGGQKFEELQQDDAVRRAKGQSTIGGSSRSGDKGSEARPLLPMGELEGADRDRVTRLRTGMWYI